MATTALARVTELDRYIAEINQYPILSAEKEQQLAKQWREHGDVRAAHTLVTSNKSSPRASLISHRVRRR